MKITFITTDSFPIFISELSTELGKFNFFDTIKVINRFDIDFYNQQHSYGFTAYNKWLNILLKPIDYFKLMGKIKENDYSNIINIHYVTPVYNYFWSTLRKQSDVIILSVWGSDFYRADINIKKKLINMIASCDALTFTNERTANDFCDFYNDLDISKKVYINRFGLKTLEYLNKTNISSEEAKVYFNLPPNKTIVTVGNSSSFGNQHEKIINYIKDIEDIKNKVFFIFPMAYGDFSYREKIENLLKSTYLDFTILKNFMSIEDLVKLRVATDIMIHLPISDQLSGSMQEHMFAGNVIITGSWLPYDTLWNKGAYALKVNDISELSGILKCALSNLDHLRKQSNKNKEVIWELSSWEKNAYLWLDTYKDVMRKSKNC